MHETPLDMTFIQHFLSASAPHGFQSGWTVEISTHYLGGGRHWADWPDWPRKWEIADIGFLVQFRQAGKLVRSKVALLQSKRLYADELTLDEDVPYDYMVGFGRLFKEEEPWSEVTAPRKFGFTERSRYQALMTGPGQYTAIREYEENRNVPVYYMLYNPVTIPTATTLPIAAESVTDGPVEVGCRIVPATQVRVVMAADAVGTSPSYGDLSGRLAAPFDQDRRRAGWRLEDFVVDLLLECEAGYIANSPSDGGLNYIFNRRTGPISAALALTLDAP